MPRFAADAFFRMQGKEAVVGGVSVSAIVAKFGTPIFIYSQEILERQLRALRDSFPPEIEIYYSIKANPNQQILRFFLRQGCGLEVASLGEFEQARTAGCEPAKIVFAGPGKTEHELEAVLGAGIGEIHAESMLELMRINKLAASKAKRARVALRVNPTAAFEGGAMRMGGKPAPFGIDEEVLDGALDFTLSASHLDFAGIHLFSGTQILDHRILVDQYKHALEIARRIVRRTGRPLNTIDFGGGLGIPYFAHEQALDLGLLKPNLEAVWRGLRQDADFRGTRFLIEPGRFLAGEAGAYVARVNDIKQSRDKKFLILDGGMHHHLAASGNLGQTIKRNYAIANISRLDDLSEEVVDVVGPLCTPLDILGRAVKLTKSEVGDLIAVLQSGAYARSASPLGFLSHPSPAEVYIEGRCARLSRRQGCTEDYLRDQVADNMHKEPTDPSAAVAGAADP